MPKSKNLPSLYPCQNLNGLQVFKTEAGIQYAIGFRNVSHYLSPVLGIYNIRVFTFDFFSSGHSQKDQRVGITIQNEVEGFFTDANLVLTYICDMSDGRAAERQRLFSQWAGKMEGIKAAKVEVTGEPDTIHGGILMREDFRHWGVLQEELFRPDRGVSAKFGA